MLPAPLSQWGSGLLPPRPSSGPPAVILSSGSPGQTPSLHPQSYPTPQKTLRVFLLLLFWLLASVLPPSLPLSFLPSFLSLLSPSFLPFSLCPFSPPLGKHSSGRKALPCSRRAARCHLLLGRSLFIANTGQTAAAGSPFLLAGVYLEKVNKEK